jgi:hypothetical protein
MSFSNLAPGEFEFTLEVNFFDKLFLNQNRNPKFAILDSDLNSKRPK